MRGQPHPLHLGDAVAADGTPFEWSVAAIPHTTAKDFLALDVPLLQGYGMTETTAVLKSILLDCRTGQARLKGMLPGGTPVAHKTGSVDDVANDVGVIALPAGRGDVVVAVFVKADLDDAVKDRMIAQLARAAHDYFLFVDGD